ncbi:MAG: metallophosphoesterase family protein [Chloroflexi bacterium]|nr:metallophosphoesterase family protein [Chloroflexota bacterium]
MRIAIISDVHANLAALEAVLRHAEAQGATDGLWCLGDTVGYGPQPSECISRLRDAGAKLVAGNHDRAATGKIGTEEFNPDAAKAALWTRDQITEDDAAYLDALPEVTHATPGREAPPAEAEFTLVHGSLRWPIWEYLSTYEAATAHLERQRTPFSLVGHTHMPMLVREGEEYPQGCEMYHLEDGARAQLDRQRRVVINPGSVGQPRDGDPRAAYAAYDTESGTVSLHRLEYDIPATQKLMEAAALPRWLINRLAVGR